MLGNLHRCAEGEPHGLRSDTVSESSGGRTVPQFGDNKVAQKRATLSDAKFIVDGTKKLAARHEDNGLTDRHVGIELSNQLIRQSVGNRARGNNLLKDRQAIGNFVHDHRQGDFQSICNGGKNFTRRLFLAAFDLAEIPESNTCSARYLAQGGAFLLTKVAENISDFVSD